MASEQGFQVPDTSIPIGVSAIVIDMFGASRLFSRDAALVAAAAFAAATLGIVVTSATREQSTPRPVASLPPASPGPVSVSYVGSRWRLTAVTDRSGTTSVPESVDAWLDLARDGRVTAFDDVNRISGHFTTTDAGFDVFDAASTLVGHDDNDLAERAARIGIGAVMFGLHGRPVRVIVLSADRGHLDVQAGGVRITFVRTGPTDR